MSKDTDANSVHKVVSVQAPQMVAWRVFTEQMGVWWPLAYYKIGKANAVDAVIEPHVGGRWYERGDDGVGTTLAPGPLVGYQRRLAV
jgi:hypothetical protein